MGNKIFSKLKPLLKSLFVFGLIFTLVMSSASSALAARTGGRMGGGSFRAPSRSYSPSGGGYRAGGGYGYGGGFGFPFLLPFFGFGGGFGGLFSILIFIAVANFLVRSFRSVADSGTQSPYGYSNPKVSVGRLQVGLISNARGLQKELNELGRTADTDSAAGRAQLLQESTLALLRHPEYWVYGATESQQTALEAAEAKFNQMSLAERSKFTEETLSNFNNQRRLGTSGVTQSNNNTELAVTEASSGYIIVTILVGIEGKLELQKINSSEDLNQALRQIGGVASERLLAVEVLWTPQAENDTLTSDDIMAGYPDLKLV
ncbi:MAG: DUF1517 domain-containing protein [Symploca sp. SIO2E9]|nr:DUF1517 domain-containing protein [Symploca sp. SIO2E9]